MPPLKPPQNCTEFLEKLEQAPRPPPPLVTVPQDVAPHTSTEILCNSTSYWWCFFTPNRNPSISWTPFFRQLTRLREPQPQQLHLRWHLPPLPNQRRLQLCCWRGFIGEFIKFTLPETNRLTFNSHPKRRPRANPKGSRILFQKPCHLFFGDTVK